MIDKFIKDAGIVGLSSILIKGMTFLLLPLLVRALSAAEYGVIEILNSYMSIASVFLTLELYQAVGRYYSGVGEEEKRELTVSGVCWYLFAFSLFLLAVILFREGLGRQIFGTEERSGVVVTASLMLASNAFFLYLQNILRFSHRTSAYAVANVLNSVIVFVLTILLVVWLKLGVTAVFAAQVTGSFAGILFILKKHAPIGTFRCKTPLLKKMFRFSLPLVPAGLAFILLSFSDRIIIRHYLPLADLGIYGVAFKLGSIILIIFSIIDIILLPMVYSHYHDHNRQKELIELYRFVFYITIFSVTLLSIFATELVQLLTVPEYYQGARLVPLILISNFFFQFGNLFLGVSIRSKTWVYAAINIFCVLFSILLNLWLIPEYGLMGAAVTSMMCAAIFFTLQYIASQRLFPLNYFSGNLMIFFTICMAAISVNYLLFNEIHLVNFAFKTLFSFLFIFILLFLMKRDFLSPVSIILDIIKSKTLN